MSCRTPGARTPTDSKALEDNVTEVRLAAARTLMKIEANPKDCVPRLLTALMSNNDEVRNAAGDALKVIDPEAAKNAGVTD